MLSTSFRVSHSNYEHTTFDIKVINRYGEADNFNKKWI